MAEPPLRDGGCGSSILLKEVPLLQLSWWVCVSLERQVDRVKLQASDPVFGAVELLNEVSATKITGEEERYSHTDLYDIAANVEGAERVLESWVRKTRKICLYSAGRSAAAAP
ncbi:MAG: hypothetical protein H0U04_05455 [Rubrobacter sp.]|nr:hypothetical protein [Rubrobacter sp.]